MGFLFRAVIILVFAGLLLTSGGMARPYDGLGPGESSIGVGGDYASLREACEAVSENSLSGGDWTFLILNDLVEPNNVSLAQETNGHTITFRPAPGTSPTVSFTTTTVNESRLVGHFAIGARTDRVNPDDSFVVVPTSNIVIDGSNDPTTSARSMTWENTGRHAGSSSIIAVFGDSKNVMVRNCILKFQTPSGNQAYNVAAVDFCSFTFALESGQDDQVPDFGRVENCRIELKEAYGWGYGVSLNNRTIGAKNTAYPPARGMVAAGNDIVSGAEAIVVRNCSDPEITGNRILINARLRSTRRSIDCIGAATPNDDGRVLLDGNTIVCTGTDLSHYSAVALSGKRTTTSFVMKNNMIINLCDTDFNAVTGVVAVVDESSTVTLVHNSFNFETSATTTQPGRYRGVDASDGTVSNQYSGNVVARNNIFRMNVDNGIVFALPDGYGASFVSDNNVIHTTTTAHLALVGEGDELLTSLADWQTSSGQDLSSVIQDPFVPAAEGLGTWMGAPDDPNQDLRFASFPGEVYLVPRMPDVLTDIDGEPRAEEKTLAGADEVERVSAVESWLYY